MVTAVLLWRGYYAGPTYETRTNVKELSSVMKAYLKFDLPEERAEYELANKAGMLHACLWEISNLIRSRLKHEEPSEAERQALETIRALIPYDL